MTKYIVVVGGVISGVGKGVTTASIGKILQSYGYKVSAVKIDPYINYDAGTLRPTEHGEVWVTDDGGEIDQDLGNYERFLGIDIPKKNNITTGQIYYKVIDNERKGKYLGETVQYIPHIPNEVKRRITDVGKDNDIVIIEIGGTVGDFENIPFLFAVKSLEKDLGKENVLYFLVSYVLIPRHTKEMKTKPTQQAIRLLSESAGIFPDFILCRAPVRLDEVRKKKIETYANIASDYVISEPDIDTIYRVPLDLEKENLGKKILDKFGLKSDKIPDWTKWKELVSKIVNPAKKIRVAIVGKYVDIGDFTLTDSYISINEALKHAGAHFNTSVEIVWIDSKTLEKGKYVGETLKGIDGIIIPGGFGSSGVEGKINAIKYARENNVPYLGLCYGMQLAIVEYARNVCGMKEANTVEVDENTKYPLIAIQDSQKSVIADHDYGGTMRLGAYAAIIEKNSQVHKLYDETGRLEKDKKRLKKLQEIKKEAFRIGEIKKDDIVIFERHRHRFEVNPKYIDEIECKGLKYSGYHLRKDGTKLMEFIELNGHPFFIGTQGHPEFKSKLDAPAPLFYGFVKAAQPK